jgi:hypothetical protein
MEVTQQGVEGKYTVKVTNYFRDTDKKENINGYPNPEGDTQDYSKDDWKLYFLQARKFLVNYTRETMQAAVAQAVIDRGVAVPQSAEQEARITEGTRVEPPKFIKDRTPSKEEVAEGIDIDDIPFD